MNLDERIATLTAQRAARLDELDLPRSLSTREVHAYLATTAALDRRILAATDARTTLATIEPQLAAEQEWLAHLSKWRAVLGDELLAIKTPIRDRATREHADRLAFCIRLIDFGLGISVLGPVVSLASLPIGSLMATAGYATEGPELHEPRGWRGATTDATRRIAEWTKRRAECQAVLDTMLRTEDEQASHDATRADMAAVLNTMDIKNNTDGDGLVAYTKDGDPLPVADMTPAQRAAFEHVAAIG